MNVLLSVPWDNLGGVCNVVNAVALYLKSQGHGVWLLLPGESDTAVETTSRVGLSAFRLNLRPKHDPAARLKGRVAYSLHRAAATQQLDALCEDLKIDAVNIHFPHAASDYFVAGRSAGRYKLLTSIHGADLLPYMIAPSKGHNSINSVLVESDAIVAPSRSFVTAASQRWPVLLNSNVSIIPNGIDPDELGYRLEARWTEDTPPYVLSVATLVPYKGVDIIIRAFAQLATEFPDVRLKLVSSGPSYPELLELAAILGVAGRIDFIGIVDRGRIAALLQGCTLFVLASRSDSESFGIAAAEAMALDRAVIVSRIGALPEMVLDDVTGLLVPPGDAHALAGAMRTALSDRQLRERLGKAAGEKVRREYLWSRTGAEYEGLLRRVVASEPILSTGIVR